MADPMKDPEVLAWLEEAGRELGDKLGNSAMSITLLTKNAAKDAKFWVELGASIMMNKPLIVAVFEDAEVPPKLALVADEIVHLPDGLTDSETGRARMEAALVRVIGSLNR